MNFYRGYDLSFGVDTPTSFIWISDDKEYAKLYGTCLVKIEICEKNLGIIPHNELEEIVDELEYDIIDILYNPFENIVEKIRIKGYNAYTINDDYSCLCLLDKSLIESVSTI